MAELADALVLGSSVHDVQVQVLLAALSYIALRYHVDIAARFFHTQKEVLFVNEAILLAGAVILICILMNRVLEKIPVPSLLIFIALGMCFGENGIFRIVFNDYASVNLICSVSLIFIMFYGGFGTNLQAAKPVLAQSVVLSTVGVAGTAGAVTLFAHFVLRLPWLESLLIGSVISSTDAASVFNILRTNKLALKYHTDSLLEVESGSNDPMSYMLTTVTLSLMAGEQISIPQMLFQQISLGVLCGLLVGKVTIWLLRQSFLDSQQNRTVLLFAVMLLAYALPAVLGGNGYLSVYLCGIFLGNAKLSQKRYLVHFFDVLTDVSQVILFFLLGLLVTPTELPEVLLPAVFLMLFLTLIARPVVVTALLLPFRACWGQIGIVSWAGLRGGSLHCVCHFCSAQRGTDAQQFIQSGVLHCIAVYCVTGNTASQSCAVFFDDRPKRGCGKNLQRLPSGKRCGFHQDPFGKRTSVVRPYAATGCAAVRIVGDDDCP